MKVNLVQDFGLLIEKFCEGCNRRDMSVESIRRYKSSLVTFGKHLTDRGIDFGDVDIEVLEGFLDYLKNERGLKHKTVENEFTALSAFYEYLDFKKIINNNIILSFRKRYLRRYKEGYDDPIRKLLSIEEMSRLVNSIMDPRDKAIAILLAKTGVRRGELLRINVDDISWADYSITLEPTRKRSNRVVFFDDECADVLRRWLKVREKLNPKTNALFVSYQTLNRLSRNGAYIGVVKYAKRLGFHNSNSEKVEDHFGPHCFRHWFTTWLLRKGMQREYIKELREDRRNEAIDIYHHIDKEEIRKAYLACIPKLGV